MSHLAYDWQRSYFHHWKQELKTKERWVSLIPLETDELRTDVLCAPGISLFVTSQQQKMSQKGLKALGRRRQCRRTVRTWWFVQITQTPHVLLECSSGTPGILSQDFLSLEGGGAHLLPPTNFIFDENAHPDPEWKQVKRRAGCYSNAAEEASSVLERQALLSNCHYGDCKISSAEGRWLHSGFPGAGLGVYRSMICGFYIKTRSRPRIPSLEVYLKTVMCMCYNLQTKVKNSKNLLATHIATSRNFAT